VIKQLKDEIMALGQEVDSRASREQTAQSQAVVHEIFGLSENMKEYVI
jgi:hypothetical protein